jgi:hypothetical protein
MFFRRKKESAPSFQQQLEAARAQGFTLEDAAAGRVRISKHGCAAVVEHAGGGRVRFVETPGVLANGEIAKLVDRGFQKFLATTAGVTRPALAEQLLAVHRFDEELRRVLHLESLYNEALGTVSNRYVYDRVQGRE